MKLIKLLILFLFFNPNVFSQNTIKGTVTDGIDVLEEANILLKHSLKGTSTNAKGNFKIRATLNDTLVISYLGRKPKEIPLTSVGNLNINLDEIEVLDAVLIEAYASCKVIYCKAICGVTMCGTDIEYTSVYNRIDNEGVKVYPNPSRNGIFNIKMIDDLSSLDVRVYDVSGRFIKQINNCLNNTIDLSNYFQGVYLLQILSEGEIIETKKVIKG